MPDESEVIQSDIFVDFLLPNVIDDATPITRLGARIKDLKDAGHHISAVGTRAKCAVYRLQDVASGAAGRPTQNVGERASDATLFEIGGASQSRPHWDEDAA